MKSVIFLMTAWMLFFMNLTNPTYMSFSLVSIVIILYGIRNQTLVYKKQYYTGMIPHRALA
jgi:hypothetical protein